MRRARSPAELGLDGRDRRRLSKALRTIQEIRCYRRVAAVLGVAQGRSVRDVAKWLGMGLRTIHRWVDRYRRKHQVQDLLDAPRSGRPLTAPAISSPALGELPTAEEVNVVAATLADFATNDQHPWSANRSLRSIIAHQVTNDGNGWLSNGQVESDLRNAEFQVSPQLIANLRTRNVTRVSLAALANRNPSIVVDDLSELDRRPFPFAASDWFRQAHPGAKAFVHTWLPGYSATGTEAVVRFTFGPTPHGATATYLLRREDGVWKVIGRNFAYYV